MASNVPNHTLSLILKNTKAQSNSAFYDAVLETRPIPKPKPGEVVVKIGAAAFNRRDVWIRQALHPAIVFDSVLGSDGAGTVVASGDESDSFIGKRVFLTPMRGWDTHPYGPEGKLEILGGGVLAPAPPIGTFTDYVVVERNQVILSPDHLDDVHMAAWPLGGLTAWRAVKVNADVKPNQNILITGIGGGVALIAMQLCMAMGANVYVTSGSDEKLEKALKLGAKGGANYKDKKWPDKIASLIQKRKKGSQLDAIIDSAGGEVLRLTGRYLKDGGRCVCFGMTAGPTITFTIREVLRNQQLIGSTLGSYQDLVDATDFIAKHRIVPIVSLVLDGLENAEEGFKLVNDKDRFGKVAIKFRDASKSNL